MYTSMRLTRISLVLNRVRSSAGIAAHAIPPSTPAQSITGKANLPSAAPQKSATPPPAMAPRVSCPSAPMFQTFARNPCASPSAQSISGVALSSSSPMPYADVSGSTKNR